MLFHRSNIIRNPNLGYPTDTDQATQNRWSCQLSQFPIPTIILRIVFQRTSKNRTAWKDSATGSGTCHSDRLQTAKADRRSTIPKDRSPSPQSLIRNIWQSASSPRFRRWFDLFSNRSTCCPARRPPDQDRPRLPSRFYQAECSHLWGVWRKRMLREMKSFKLLKL